MWLNSNLRNDFPIHELVDDLKVEVFKWLSVKDLCNCSRVCKAWRVLIETRNEIWKQKFKELDEDCSGANMNKDPLREEFKLYYDLEVWSPLKKYDTIEISENGKTAHNKDPTSGSGNWYVSNKFLTYYE